MRTFSPPRDLERSASTWPLLTFLATSPELPDAALDTLAQIGAPPVRQAMAARADLPERLRLRLAGDSYPTVRHAAMAHDRDPGRVARRAADSAAQSRIAAASNRSTTAEQLVMLTERAVGRVTKHTTRGESLDLRVLRRAVTNPSLPASVRHDVLKQHLPTMTYGLPRPAVRLFASGVLSADPGARVVLAHSSDTALAAAAAAWVPITPDAACLIDPDTATMMDVVQTRARRLGPGALALLDAAAANPCLPDAELEGRYRTRRDRLRGALDGTPAHEAVRDPSRHLALVRAGSRSVDALLAEQCLEPAVILALSVRRGATTPKVDPALVAALVDRGGVPALAVARVGLSRTDIEELSVAAPAFAASALLKWGVVTWRAPASALLSGAASLATADLPTLRSAVPSSLRLRDGSDVAAQARGAARMLGTDEAVWTTLVDVVGQDPGADLEEAATIARSLHAVRG